MPDPGALAKHLLQTLRGAFPDVPVVLHPLEETTVPDPSNEDEHTPKDVHVIRNVELLSVGWVLGPNGRPVSEMVFRELDDDGAPVRTFTVKGEGEEIHHA